MSSKKKKFSEEYALKILMGFEPLDEWDYISKVPEERKEKESEKSG